MWAPLQDALLGFSFWAVMRLLGIRWSPRELLLCGLVLGLFNWWRWVAPSDQATFPGGPISAFVSSCAPHADVETCQCARDRLEAELGRTEFVRLAVRIAASGTVPQELAAALSRCEGS